MVFGRRERFKYSDSILFAQIWFLNISIYPQNCSLTGTHSHSLVKRWIQISFVLQQFILYFFLQNCSLTGHCSNNVNNEILFSSLSSNTLQHSTNPIGCFSRVICRCFFKHGFFKFVLILSPISTNTSNIFFNNPLFIKYQLYAIGKNTDEFMLLFRKLVWRWANHAFSILSIGILLFECQSLLPSKLDLFDSVSVMCLLKFGEKIE